MPHQELRGALEFDGGRIDHGESTLVSSLHSPNEELSNWLLVANVFAVVCFTLALFGCVRIYLL